MASNALTARRPTAIKILIAGGFGVGKTTLVGAVSEITPLTTEEVMTDAARRASTTPSGRGRQDDHHRGHGLRPDHASVDRS